MYRRAGRPAERERSQDDGVQRHGAGRGKKPNSAVIEFRPRPHLAVNESAKLTPAGYLGFIWDRFYFPKICAAPKSMRAAAVRLLLCVAVGAAAVPLELRSDETVEYELAPSDKWQWFMLRTNNVQGVVAGLVVQRGNNDNFPRMGFVATSSTGTLPPGSISGADFDPSTYNFATPSGATKYFWDSPSTPRPTTDWRVLTVGFDGAAPAESPLDVHIPLHNVLIGVRCNEDEEIWGVDAVPGCRYSLTATHLPWALEDGTQVRAPMEPGDTHAFRIELGSFDSFRLRIERDGVNSTRTGSNEAYGLIGAALLQRIDWPQPHSLTFPSNLSKAPEGTELPFSEDELQAMLRWQRQQPANDPELININGCVDGDDGCRTPPTATVSAALGYTGLQLVAARQSLLRENLWARALPNGIGHSALWAGSTEAHLERLCVGPTDEGSFWVVLQAHPTASGDGRLSNGLDGMSATMAIRGAPAPGVDSTGWRDGIPGSLTPYGCWCCAAGKCNVPCTDECASIGQMPPASARRVLGYTLHVEHLRYSADPVSADARLDGVSRAGCVSYGQWRYYRVPTSGAADAQVLVSISVDVKGIYAAQGVLPTEIDHSIVARTGQRSLSLSTCEPDIPTLWWVGVHLGGEAEGLLETRFVLNFTARSAAANIGDEIVASGCCGGYGYWRVPNVPDAAALTATVTVQQGAVHAVFVQFDTCPRWDLAKANDQRCGRYCEATWLTRWHPITGERTSDTSGAVAVPMGLDLATNDERQGGTWYVGVKALPGEHAIFTLALALDRPPTRVSNLLCGANERFCASGAVSAASAADRPVSTSAQAERPQLQTSAAGPRRARAGIGSPSMHSALHAALAAAGILFIARQR